MLKGATIVDSGNPTTTGTTTTITNNNGARLYRALQNGLNAGTLQLQAKANGAEILTILIGSSCVMN